MGQSHSRQDEIRTTKLPVDISRRARTRALVYSSLHSRTVKMSDLNKDPYSALLTTSLLKPQMAQISVVDEEVFETVPRFDEVKFNQIVNLHQGQRQSYLEGPKIMIWNRRLRRKTAKVGQFPARLAKEIFPACDVAKHQAQQILFFEIDRDVIDVKSGLGYLIDCVKKGMLADVESDEAWGEKILEKYTVFGAENGVTRMIQSASDVLRRIENEEEIEMKKRRDEQIEARNRRIAQRAWDPYQSLGIAGLLCLH